MKFVLFAFLLIFLTGFANCTEDDGGRILSRVRRFTCDVLSFEAGSVKFNHAACALHCLSLKKSGGYCNDKGVCVCR